MWTESRMGRHRTRESPRPEQARKPEPGRGEGASRAAGSRRERGSRRAANTRGKAAPPRHFQGFGLGPLAPCPGFGGNTSGRPQPRKGLPKVCNKITHARLRLGGTSWKCTSPGTPSAPRPPHPHRPLAPLAPQPLLQPGLLLPRAGGAWRRRRRRAGHLVVIPDADARGRAKVAAPRQVCEERRVETQKA